MKRIIALFLAAIVMMTALPLSFAAQAADADAAADGEYVLDEIIIGFFPRSQFQGREKQYDDEVAKVVKDGLSLVTDNVYVVRSEDFRKNPNATLNRYKNSEFIQYVEPNYILKTQAVPDDPSYSTQGIVLRTLNAPAGWDIVTGEGPVIAIVDTGVASHTDLPRAQNGYSAVSTLAYGNDAKGHGTQVAGVAGAIGNNGVGITGVNWSANLMTVKVDDAKGTLSTANVAKGIIWAADNGARIINLSLGSQTNSTTMKNAIDYAYNKGCVIVAASGNEGVNAVSYPARYPNVLAVGSTINGTSRASSSNYGAGLDVVGIGTYKSTTASGGYTNVGGTSFASPQAAALASLMWAVNPSLTNDQIYSYIRQGAKPLGGGYNNETAYGLIDIGKTLELVQTDAKPQKTTEPTTDESTPASLQGDPTSFLKEAATGSRNDYNGSVGYEFECLTDMTVSYIGRPRSGTMSSSHSVYIWDVKTGSLLASATVDPDAPLDALGFKVAELSQPLALKAGETYRIVSAEAAGGDKWYDVSQAGSLSPQADCRITTAVYTAEGAHASYPANTYSPGGNKGYVGITFYYSLNAAVQEPEAPSQPEYKTPPVITLNGSSDVTFYTGEEYVEAGYKAVDSKGVSLTGAVRVTDNINIWTPGIYKVEYTVEDAGGNTACETRTVRVIEREATPAPANAPTLTIIGSDPIILYLDSDTPYTEQGAMAYDETDGDLSGTVQISGSVNRNQAGTYDLIYRVVNSAGVEATATRSVRILAPTEAKEPRTAYNFSGQGKAASNTTHKNVAADEAGYMDFSVTSIDKNMTIRVEVKNQSTGATVYTNTFTGLGGTQFWAGAGTYDIAVTITAANGNSKYGVRLVTPEVLYFIYEAEEVPLSSPELVKSLISEGRTPLEICLSFDWPADALNDYYADFVAAGWTADELAWFGVEGVLELSDGEVPLSAGPDAGNTGIYVVVDGDNLCKVVVKCLGDASRWREIYAMNQTVIGQDPNLLHPGQVLKVARQ